MGTRNGTRIPALGRRIRATREARDLTGSTVANAAGIAQGTLSKVERGKLAPSIDLLCRIGNALDVPLEELEQWLAEAQLIPSGSTLPYDFLRSGDVERFQRTLEALERKASLLRMYQAQLVPGQLQTRPYASAVMRLARTMPPAILKRSVEARMRRRAIVNDGKQCIFVLTEGALRARVASSQVIAEQLEELSRVAQLPNVQLGIIPWRAQLTSVPSASFYIYDATVAHVELPHHYVQLSDRKEVAVYEELFASQMRLALTGDGCIAALKRIQRDHLEIAVREQEVGAHL